MAHVYTSMKRQKELFYSINLKLMQIIFTALYIPISWLCYFQRSFSLCAVLAIYEGTHQKTMYLGNPQSNLSETCFISFVLAFQGYLNFRIFFAILHWFGCIKLQSSMQTSKYIDQYIHVCIYYIHSMYQLHKINAMWSTLTNSDNIQKTYQISLNSHFIYLLRRMHSVHS